MAKSHLILIAFLVVAGGSPWWLSTATAEQHNTNTIGNAYIENFVVPEMDPNGNLRWKLMGARGQMVGDGKMIVQDIRAEFFSSNKVAMTFTSPNANLDQPNKFATTDAPIRLEGSNLVVTGVGADWSGSNNTFFIRSHVRVTISPERKMP